MPDFERRSSASFISSKEGGTPDSFRRSLMKRRSSYCLRVSISTSPQVVSFDCRDRSDTPRSEAFRISEPGVRKLQVAVCSRQYSKQIMNGHYMFHMCSATT